MARKSWSKRDYALVAKGAGLLIAETVEGDSIGIGKRGEFEALIADGILPSDTVLREPLAVDF